MALFHAIIDNKGRAYLLEYNFVKEPIDFSFRKDGNTVGFGTSFQMAFFQMPDNYEIEDMEEIVNHSYVSKYWYEIKTKIAQIVEDCQCDYSNIEVLLDYFNWEYQ
ncbi:hypothetical protein HCB46_00230 [Listeria ivanovii]|uniref:hypothetical protein n=1 Tax=Listeria TaxID=1637 RepID=UPI00162A9B1B|nr:MULTISPECIES: hypothetical protein [Listeria]MBC2253896.1 hypothetical protein [Listeria ivanovii]